MTVLTLPFSRVDDDNVGSVTAVTAVETTVPLVGGIYKIAAMGTNIQWKKGDTPVTDITGSYLADGDQEVIKVAPGGETLRVIRSTNSSADGFYNLVVIELFEVPGADPRPYMLS